MTVFDLSLPVSEAMAGVSITTARTVAKDGWNATTLSLYSHSGTHMDAPCHFLPDGNTLDQQDLSACVGPAHIIDLTPVQPRQLIEIADVTRKLPAVAPGSRLLLRTDWSKKYGTTEYRDQLPRISLPLAHWLVERKVALIGVEAPSVADVNNLDEVTAVHQVLFRGGILIVEGLCGLDKLTEDVVEFVALPLKISGGDGSPVRAIAIQRNSVREADNE